jgi:hypothetical protein
VEGGPDRLIVEDLDGEVLVYDTERDEAHASCIPPTGVCAANSDRALKQHLAPVAPGDALATLVSVSRYD